MGKTMTLAAKFSEEETNRIDSWAAAHGLSRSGAIHEIVMGAMQPCNNVVPTDSTVKNEVVTFRFNENFSYFWKNKEYSGFLAGDEAHIKFGGEWMIYKLSDIPVEIVR